MTRGLNNWTHKDIVDFLKDNEFEHSHTRGSHFYYKKRNSGKDYLVTVPFHGAKAINPKTFKSIIDQSGIERDKWIE